MPETLSGLFVTYWIVALGFSILIYPDFLMVYLKRYELGRQPANTKLSSNKTVRRIRVRGENVKWRALRRHRKLLLGKRGRDSAIAQVDAAPFKQRYLQHYNIDIGCKKKTAAAAGKKESEVGGTLLFPFQLGETAADEVVKKNHVLRKLLKRQENRTHLEPHIDEQFGGGRLLARLATWTSNNKLYPSNSSGKWVLQAYLGRQRAGVLHEEDPEKEGEGCCLKFCHSSNTAESSVGGNLEVVRVIEHTRNKDIWDHYDLCEMSNGSRRARCKLCLKFLASEGNTTLKNHLTKSCKALRSRSDPSQSNLTPQGGVFVYDNEKLREAFTKFVITKHCRSTTLMMKISRQQFNN
ncbi:40S ribosomal protein S8 [Hibiscus syriacus]|uniref:40S ribosomal protein S8 n=1 Tax=Hibiscus syriacus TaxID=106335 RepID=A0A6A3AM76_HIBSY|nr:40S ribosomal protein S8 [Hibiscus syriacus]